jgi:hypothetical protein
MVHVFYVILIVKYIVRDFLKWHVKNAKNSFLGYNIPPKYSMCLVYELVQINVGLHISTKFGQEWTIFTRDIVFIDKPWSFWPLINDPDKWISFVSNKATPHKIHNPHHTHPSFIFRLKYPQKSGPCFKNKNEKESPLGSRKPITGNRNMLYMLYAVERLADLPVKQLIVRKQLKYGQIRSTHSYESAVCHCIVMIKLAYHIKNYAVKITFSLIKSYFTFKLLHIWYCYNQENIFKRNKKIFMFVLKILYFPIIWRKLKGVQYVYVHF